MKVKNVKTMKLVNSSHFVNISSQMASVGIYVSDDSELMREIKHKAETLHDGKVSAYLRSLLERALAGEQKVSSQKLKVVRHSSFDGQKNIQISTLG